MEIENFKALLDFIFTQQHVSKSATQEEIELALQLTALLSDWAYKKGLSEEGESGLLAKSYVIIMLAGRQCPINMVYKRANPEKKKPKHRPRKELDVCCAILLYARQHSISATARHFQIHPKTVRESITSLARSLNDLVGHILERPIGAYPDLLSLQIDIVEHLISLEANRFELKAEVGEK